MSPGCTPATSLVFARAPLVSRQSNGVFAARPAARQGPRGELLARLPYTLHRGCLSTGNQESASAWGANAWGPVRMLGVMDVCVAPREIGERRQGRKRTIDDLKAVAVLSVPIRQDILEGALNASIDDDRGRTRRALLRRHCGSQALPCQVLSHTYVNMV